MGTGIFSAGVKRQGRKADHSLPSRDEVKNECSYTFTSPYVFMEYCLRIKEGNFTFTLLLRVYSKNNSFFLYVGRLFNGVVSFGSIEYSAFSSSSSPLLKFKD
jgi:hypothetical protein